MDSRAIQFVRERAEHFSYIDGNIVGATQIGRTTVSLLAMNDPDRLRLRRRLLWLGLLGE